MEDLFDAEFGEDLWHEIELAGGDSAAEDEDIGFESFRDAAREIVVRVAGGRDFDAVGAGARAGGDEHRTVAVADLTGAGFPIDGH